MNNGHDFGHDDHKDLPGGSILGAVAADEHEARMDEMLTLSRRDLAISIEQGALAVSEDMAKQFNLQEKMLHTLENENTQLRRDITALKYKIAKTING